jgi:methylenetetrahydrofolate--tRNA-(uracil-5-)-methyltransferase
LGALLNHITGAADAKTFQPMNVNFGLFPELPAPAGLTRAQEKQWRAERKPALARRALDDLAAWKARLGLSEPTPRAAAS